jgi:hypothetical protein
MQESVAQLEGERARLVADVEGAAAARAHLEETHARALEEARAEAQAASARLAEQERELEQLRGERARELEEIVPERDQLREALAVVEADRARLAAEIDGAAAVHRDQEETHARMLDEARAQAEETAGQLAQVATQLAERQRELEGLRDEATVRAGEVTQLTAEQDRLREAVAGLEADRARLGAELEGAAAARALLEEARARVYDEVHAQGREVETRLSERERELNALRAEHASTVAHLTARVEEIAGERDQVRETFAREAEEARARAEWRAARDGARERVELLRAERAAENTSLIARVDVLLAERDQLRERMATLEAERDRLAAEAEKASVAAPPSAPSATPAAPAPPKPPPAAPKAPAGTAAPRRPAAKPAPTPTASGARRVVVIDANTAWAANLNGHPVTVLAPDGDLLARLGEIGNARVVVNLAGKGAIDALIALRGEGFAPRFWGCLADAVAGRGAALGMVEPAARPLDPEAVMAALGTYATRGTRVVTVGSDVDALVSLRQALARQGLSVSMAWDSKQAADLIGMVRPEVLVIDLGLPAREATAMAARIAASDPVPHAVFIAGAADSAPAFAAALKDPSAARRAVPLERLLAQLVGGNEARASERR